MRNPDRIDEFCDELAKLWHTVPDWRFSQLIDNVFRWYGRDAFYVEDDDMLRLIKELFDKHKGCDIAK